MINMYRVHYYNIGPADLYNRIFVIIKDCAENPEDKPEVERIIDYMRDPQHFGRLLLEALNYVSAKKEKVISVLPDPDNNLCVPEYYCYWIITENQ